MVDKLTKFIKKQDKNVRELVFKLISNIKVGDLAGCDIKRLKASSNLYRLRKGRIRIVFEQKGKDIIVKKVTYRDDQTYCDV